MRRKEGLVLVEGIRAVGEALDASASPRFAVVSPRLSDLTGGPSLRSRLGGLASLHVVGDSELARLADTEHPQGVLAVFAEPDDPGLAKEARYVILDGVQDPGNVGTIIRAAVGFGLDGVVALEGTADPWGAKAVRASAGMAFRIPVTQCSWEEAREGLSRVGVGVIVGDAAGRDARSLAPPRTWALVVGSEGKGPRDSVRAAADQVLGIHLRGPAESLNVGVAAAVLMYALTREDGVD
ncbi:MAG: RNA methyltransferase [Gemmatimonadota bacterium]|jgi:TrmH family RNA methyltransferase